MQKRIVVWHGSTLQLVYCPEVMCMHMRLITKGSASVCFLTYVRCCGNQVRCRLTQAAGRHWHTWQKHELDYKSSGYCGGTFHFCSAFVPDQAISSRNHWLLRRNTGVHHLIFAKVKKKVLQIKAPNPSVLRWPKGANKAMKMLTKHLINYGVESRFWPH